MRIGEPRRGDIVMLCYPLDPAKSFVKRVIAEEGDTVRIVEGRVYVNDIRCTTATCRQSSQPRRLGAQVIPSYYFVMGDHRNNSSTAGIGAWFPSVHHRRCRSAGGGPHRARVQPVARDGASTISRVLFRVLILNRRRRAKIAFGYEQRHQHPV
jgi:signal peptidase I